MNRLAQKNLAPSRLGFGSAPIGNLYQSITDSEAILAVQAAYECGTRLFDTAPLYGAGLAERRLGEALRGVERKSYLLQSKVGRVLDQGRLEFDLSTSGLERSLEGSLQRLQVSSLDLVLLHDPDQHEAQAVASALPTLLAWREQGMVRAVGLGMNQWQMPQRLLQHFELDLVLLAGRYTLLEQGALGFLDECAKTGVAVLAGGVFNSGILATGAGPNSFYNYQAAPPELLQKTRQLEAVCLEFGVPLAAAAVQFVLRHSAVVCAVLGASQAKESRQHWQFLVQTIPTDFWSALKYRGLLTGETP
jgi:D-threo-aldose 1-dehydrogenase